MQSGICTQTVDAGQCVQVAKKLIVEIGKCPVGGWRKPVPVIKRALLLDGIAVLHPRSIIERRNVALEHLRDSPLEEVVDYDVRERLGTGERGAQPAPIDIVSDHAESRL